MQLAIKNRSFGLSRRYHKSPSMQSMRGGGGRTNKQTNESSEGCRRRGITQGNELHGGEARTHTKKDFVCVGRLAGYMRPAPPRPHPHPHLISLRQRDQNEISRSPLSLRVRCAGKIIVAEEVYCMVHIRSPHSFFPSLLYYTSGIRKSYRIT